MTKETNAKTFFTADHHFGHERAIGLNGRSFHDVDAMREVMIANWNAVVRSDDVVHHLGDFAYRCRPDERASIFGRLNGRKHLVAGNHDDETTRILGWESVSQIAEIVVDSQRLVLCHYPMLEWPGFHHKRNPAWHLFGHVHGNTQGVGRSLDVGVDVWDFAPVSLSQIRRRLREKGAIE